MGKNGVLKTFVESLKGFVPDCSLDAWDSEQILTVLPLNYPKTHLMKSTIKSK